MHLPEASFTCPVFTPPGEPVRDGIWIPLPACWASSPRHTSKFSVEVQILGPEFEHPGCRNRNCLDKGSLLANGCEVSLRDVLRSRRSFGSSVYGSVNKDIILCLRGSATIIEGLMSLDPSGKSKRNSSGVDLPGQTCPRKCWGSGEYMMGDELEGSFAVPYIPCGLVPREVVVGCNNGDPLSNRRSLWELAGEGCCDHLRHFALPIGLRHCKPCPGSYGATWSEGRAITMHFHPIVEEEGAMLFDAVEEVLEVKRVGDWAGVLQDVSWVR